MKLICIVALMFTCLCSVNAQTKWTVVFSEGKVYGGITADLTPITNRSFGLVESVYLEGFTAIRFMNVDKTPLFAGLSVAFRFKPTDTGFSTSFGIGAGWVQQTERIVPCLTFSARF